jgi:geranylgeranyl diphosphate synthase, type II
MSTIETPSSDAFETVLHGIFAFVSKRSPARLKEAMEYALFPGGGRVRPKMCLEVFSSIGGQDLAFAMHAAAAVEFLHCGSLVHDDLPCFDNAETRRGKPSLHVSFGESTAVLVGDGLISAAFEAIASSPRVSSRKIVEAVRILGEALGASHGLVAGQAMETDPGSSLTDIHRAKTGALFGASAALGALAAGGAVDPWKSYGLSVGYAYQLADDIMDTKPHADLGKPSNRDSYLNRPNAAIRLGHDAAVRQFQTRLAESIDAIPYCQRPEGLIDLTEKIVGRWIAFDHKLSN